MAADTPQSKSDRREAARRQAVALKQAQLKKEARVRRITLLSIAAGVLLVVGLGVLVVTQGIKKESVDLNATAPVTATGVNGGIPFGQDGVAGTQNEGAITVEVYSDFLCSYCAVFEQTNLATLDEFRQSGEITLVLHPLSMLSRGSQTAYSSRAASAFAYLADNAPEYALEFNSALFANFPAQSSDGLSDDDLVRIATQVGVPEAVAAASVGGDFVAWTLKIVDDAAANTEVAGDEGRLGTPTVLIDGKRYPGDPSNPDQFRAALTEAVAGG
ncbi:Protein-disulfide isomerase [Micrococcales bacterium KH10]|nr:Protein-disulfide isomerase [Micrococcales bacterium KH10]